MNVISHPTAWLASWIIDFEQSAISPPKCIGTCLRVAVMPAFLALELVFKEIPIYLSAQFTVNPYFREKSYENIQKLIQGILLFLNPALDVVSVTFPFLSISAQHRLIIDNPYRLQYASLKVKNNYEIVLEAIQLDGKLLQYASQELRGDPQIVLHAIRNNGLALKYASIELRDNYEIVLTAINNNGLALRYASSALKNNGELVIIAFYNDFHSLKYASKDLRNHYDFMILLIKENGIALKYASLRLRNNFKIVLAAVCNNGLALQFASVYLRSNRKIVTAAIKNKSIAYNFASGFLKNDPKIRCQFYHSLVPKCESVIGDKQYVPKVLKPHLKFLELPKLIDEITLDQVADHLREFVDNLEELQLPTIRRELLREDLTLESAKDLLNRYLNLLFTRVEQKLAYLGTPPEGSQELVLFYEKIELYFKNLFVFLTKEENKMPQALIERLQILQTQSACGARFQSELEQLFSMNCIACDSMSIDKQFALIASTCLQKSIEAIVVDANVHSINILNWQLDSYLVGPKVVKDHLGRPLDEITLMSKFFTNHTTLNIVTHIQKALKSSSELEALFSQCIVENVVYEASDKEFLHIQEHALKALRTYFENKKHKFKEYKKAKAGGGIYGTIKSDEKLLQIFSLKSEEAQCFNQEELMQFLESSKTNLLKYYTNQALKDFHIEKIYESYFDTKEMKWKKSIIAIVLEKMGILEEIN